MGSFQRNALQGAALTGEGFPASSSVVQRQHDPFDPSQINNLIILLAMSDATGDWPRQ
jgi:hypothetical protein